MEHELMIDSEVDFSPPEGVSLPLWRSLFRNLRDRIAPEKLPPLRLSSRPINLGMMLGDYLDLPWYRTIFTNLGDVISPETLPPLQLESRPLDVGELIGDQVSRPWWTSLLRNLADRVAPEKLPPLDLSSAPVNPMVPSPALLLACWSNVIEGPKVFLPDSAAPVLTAASPGLVLPAMPTPAPDPGQVEFVHILENDLRRDLHRSRMRERLLIAILVIEVILLVGGYFWPR
jgi:hypothetical protein